MRKSLQGIENMVRPIPYHGTLPDEIKHLHYYISDSGHCIMAIPRSLVPEITDEPMEYEAALPVKYVLEKGWEKLPSTDCIVVDVEYDDMIGAVVPESYEEW